MTRSLSNFNENFYLLKEAGKKEHTRIDKAVLQISLTPSNIISLNCKETILKNDTKETILKTAYTGAAPVTNDCFPGYKQTIIFAIHINDNTQKFPAVKTF